MKKVYIAGPYTRGNQMYNVNQAVHAADRLLEAGAAPYIPHLSAFWDFMSPKPYLVWLNYDIEWLQVCDAVYRLPGESLGADKECALAASLSIPVFHTLEDCESWVRS